MSDRETIQKLIDEGQVEQVLTRGSAAKEETKALQRLLYKLGLGTELNWKKYGADGGYGGSTTHAVKAFANRNDLAGDGETVTREMAEKLIARFDSLGLKDEPAAGNLSIRETEEGGKTRVYISDDIDEVRFTRFKKGVYYFGKQKTIDAVNVNRASLQAKGLTDSAMNVMIAVSENEGNLDAINTWDNSFMTFGMFQWTIGAGTDPGELTALLEKIKTTDPGLFQKYYGQYGLDIELVNNISGYMILEGQKLASPSDKERLRTIEWSYYFWKSGQDPQVQVIQIQHALSRLSVFYRSDSYKPNGFYISDLVTSEYGVGLLLDNHVNRPGYVTGCLAQAMEQTQLLEPENWGTSEEMRLIEAYLKVRASYGKYPMTDADKRADVTKKYLDNGTISAERGSFQYNL